MAKKSIRQIVAEELKGALTAAGLVPAAPKETAVDPKIAEAIALLKAAGINVGAAPKAAEPFTFVEGDYQGKPLVTLKNGGMPFSFGPEKAKLILMAKENKAAWALIEKTAKAAK